MRWYVVLCGLLLTDAANAIECREPRAPEFPVDTPIDQRAEKRLSRKVVRYMSDTGKFIVCLRKHDSEDPLTITRENAALDAVTGLLDRFETEIGHSEILVEEIKDIVPLAHRAAVERRVAAVVRNYEGEAIPTLNTAIAYTNAGRLADARAALGELDTESMTPFERGKAEEILYTISYKEEDFAAAREHLRNMIASGGLSQDQAFRARIALADVDVMLRLSATVDPRARGSNVADNSTP